VPPLLPAALRNSKNAISCQQQKIIVFKTAPYLCVCQVSSNLMPDKFFLLDQRSTTIVLKASVLTATNENNVASIIKTYCLY